MAVYIRPMSGIHALADAMKKRSRDGFALNGRQHKPRRICAV